MTDNFKETFEKLLKMPDEELRAMINNLDMQSETALFIGNALKFFTEAEFFIKDRVKKTLELMDLNPGEKLIIRENTETGSKLYSITNSVRNSEFWIASFTTVKEAYNALVQAGISSDKIAIEGEGIKAVKEYEQYIIEHMVNVQMVWQVYHGMCISQSRHLPNVDKIHHVIRHHDISKFSEEEFPGYRRKFYATVEEKLYADQREIEDQFQKAWLHHVHNNDHHWEYWIQVQNKGEIVALEMPIEASIHMLCDWTAMSIKFNNLPSEWFDKNREKMVLHENTERLILELLPEFDETFQYVLQSRSQMLTRSLTKFQVKKENFINYVLLSSPIYHTFLVRNGR